MILAQIVHDWSDQFPEDQWQAYRPALQAILTRGPLTALGGGLAYSYYTGTWRNTKDIDLYVRPQDRQSAIDLLTEHGWEDYHSHTAYDRDWIYRGYRNGLLIDVIWQMANYRATVEEQWLVRGPQTHIKDLTIRVLPVEELVFAKLYVIQRERCDWPDLLNLLYANASKMDWQHLIDLVGNDRQLLQGLLHVFAWLCPERAASIPELAWERDAASSGSIGPQCVNAERISGKPVSGERVRLLDTRPWFVALEARRR